MNRKQGPNNFHHKRTKLLKRTFLIKSKEIPLFLIGLLAVVAIIGILAGIFFLSPGREKAKTVKDAKIASDLTQIRTLSQKIFSTDANYASVETNADINILIGDINDQGGANILRTGNIISYCVEVKLSGSKWGCVNSGLTANFDLHDDPACNGVINGNSTNTYCQ